MTKNYIVQSDINNRCADVVQHDHSSLIHTKIPSSTLFCIINVLLLLLLFLFLLLWDDSNFGK